MKANRGPRAALASTREAAGDQDAVSSVVSAVLMFVLFTTLFVAWVAQTLPEWEADREHLHQRSTAETLSTLKGGLEGLSARADSGPVTATLHLGTPPVPLVQPVAARGELTFASGTAGLSTATTFASGTMVMATGGAVVASPSVPTTTPVCPTATPMCVSSLTGLVLGAVTSSVSSTASASLVVTVTDSATTPVTATATLSHAGTGADCSGEVRLVTATAAFPLLCGAGTALGATSAPFRVDLLDPAYGFGATVARLKAPLSVTFATSVAGGGVWTASTYSAVWQDVGGIEKAVGTGVASTKPVPDQTGSRLVFSPSYLHFPRQQLAFEGGAVLSLHTAAQQAVVTDPSFTMRVANGVGYVRWTLVQLTGTGQVSGEQDASVQVTHLASQDVVVVTPATCSPCTTVSLTTPSSSGWAKFLDARTLTSGAGASAAASTASSTATLTLNSGSGQPVTGGWVVHLRIIQADGRVS